MPTTNRKYIAIDLKSFYASVECVERGLDPLDTCLVVADSSRTEKTICLAVSPGLKKFGIGGRPRLFEVVQRIREVNRTRGQQETSFSYKELMRDHRKKVDYVVAPPRMAFYIDYSTRVYNVYLRYISKDDIHVYSIDEVFIDVTDYLKAYRMSAHDLALVIIRDILAETGITATAGIGDNLYLSKIAMDIVAKKMPPDKDGVRIAELSELSYRELLWNHRPLTDFWRVGKGTARRLATYGIDTMGGIAACSLEHEDILYSLFGVNAELLIDHAWGWEPVTIKDIKNYRPENHSLSSGQVLSEAYTYEKARVVIEEMADSLSLEMVEKRVMTNQLVLHIGYDVDSLANPSISAVYSGTLHRDHYGRIVPSPSHGSVNLACYTSSSRKLTLATLELFDRIVNHSLLFRRLNIAATNLKSECELNGKPSCVQLDLFSNYESIAHEIKKDKKSIQEEYARQQLILELRKKFGKNVILKGINFAEGATQKQRNGQIGGHKA